MPRMKKEYYTVKETAKVVGVHPTTVHRWIKKKLIPATHLAPNYPYRIYYLDIPTFKRTIKCFNCGKTIQGDIFEIVIDKDGNKEPVCESCFYKLKEKGE